MNRPLRTLSIVVVLLLGALVFIEFAAEGLQAFGTRGSRPPDDFVVPTLERNRF